MKKCLMFFILVPLYAFSYETCITNGYKFSYVVSNGKATLTGDTKDMKFSGDLVIPATVNGIPVACIGGDSFCMIPNLKNVIIENGVREIAHAAFYADGTGPISVTIPPSVVIFSGWWLFRTVPLLYWTVSGEDLSMDHPFAIFYGTVFLDAQGGVPKNMAKQGVTPYFNTVPYFTCRRQFANDWISFYDIHHFMGFKDPGREVSCSVLSVSMRANDPTIMDVNYNVKSAGDKVKVRALAYQTGIKSFANVLRPATFTADTKMNVGDNVKPNETHMLSWHVSADVASGMSDIAFEVLAIDEEPLALELTSIPATSSHRAITYSWNALSDDMIKNALYWYYACGESDLTLENGILKANGITLASGTSLSNAAKAAEYVLGKMGYSILSGDELAYVNSMTNLGLSPSGPRQYAVKYP
jgi:hypothetical protein